MATLCFDLDGTLCTNTEGEYDRAEPFDWAIARVNALAEAGHRIVIYTARGTATGISWEPVTREQLAHWGVVYDELRFGKPSAEVFIDDRAVHTEAWRCGSGFGPPGLAVWRSSAEASSAPELPAVLPPHVPTVVEIGRTFGGRPVRLEQHVVRAHELATSAGVSSPPASAEIAAAVHRALREADHGDDLTFAICLAAAGHMAYLDAWCGTADARLAVSCRRLYEAGRGLAAMTSPDARQGGPAVNAGVHAVAPGRWPLRVEPTGTVSAGLGARLCVVEAGEIMIEPSSAVSEVAVDWLRELAAQLGIAVTEQPLSAKHLDRVEEAFIIGMPFCLLPLAAVDDRPLDLAPGSVGGRLLAAWSRAVEIDIAAQTAALCLPKPQAPEVGSQLAHPAAAG